MGTINQSTRKLFYSRILILLKLFIILSTLLTSCDTMIGFMTCLFSPSEKNFENKISYDSEELLNLRKMGYPYNGFFCTKCIDYDDDWIYCVTDDDDLYSTSHGVLVKSDYAGEKITSVVISDAAREAGYDECYAYELRTVDVFEDTILINGEESKMFPRYTELICLDKNTLEVLWHWHSVDGGWSMYSTIAKWKDRYIFPFRYMTSDTYAYLTILDKDGKELVTKGIGDTDWDHLGKPMIYGDLLIIRTSCNSYEAYDLNLLLNPELKSEDCLISSQDEEGSCSTTSGITSDNSCFYTHSAMKSETYGIMDCFIECYDIITFKKNWKTHLDEIFHLTWAIPTLHKEKLYVPVDEGGVYCLDAKTGKKLWYTDIRKKQEKQFNVNLFQNMCVISDKWLCVPCNSSQELIVLDIHNGDILARIPCSLAFNYITCFQEGDYLYLAGANSLYRFRFWEK